MVDGEMCDGEANNWAVVVTGFNVERVMSYLKQGDVTRSVVEPDRPEYFHAYPVILVVTIYVDPWKWLDFWIDTSRLVPGLADSAYRLDQVRSSLYGKGPATPTVLEFSRLLTESMKPVERNQRREPSSWLVIYNQRDTRVVRMMR